jgi:glyoxylase-like metal-dependent hydrolase (beta-lactamase superfamily II)
MTLAPGIQRLLIGDVTITRVMEIDTLVIPPSGMVKTDHAEIKQYDWLIPNYATAEGDIRVHLQAFVIDTGDRRTLVDPCCGNDKPRPNFAIGNMLQTRFIEHLTDAGYPPDSIDIVFCTHLHLDHVGWNTQLIDGLWKPTFPNARYLFAKIELEHAIAHPEENGAIFEDSIAPILDAGLADLVDFEHMITPAVRIVPMPGHTPGHCAIYITSGDEAGIITGDLIHHPIQAASPNTDSNFCFDPDEARSTRKALLDQIADTQIVLLGTHFADPFAIRVKSDGAAWRFEPAKR